MDIDTLEGLKRCPLFKGVEETEIMDLMHTVRYKIVRCRKGEVFAFAGSVCQFADIVISGEMVSTLMGPTGRIIRMTALQTGELLAPAFLFVADNHYPVNVEASTDTTVLRLTSSYLEKLLHCDQRLTMNYVRLLSNIISRLTKKISMLSMSVHEKVCFYLMEQSRLQHSNHLIVPLSRQEWADHFGIQKYSLQRCLNELKQKGVISVEGRHIHIISQLMV